MNTCHRGRQHVFEQYECPGGKGRDLFTIVSFSVFKFGPTVNAVGQIRPGGSSASPSDILSLNPVDLSIPWQSLQDAPSQFSLLSWHTKISKFSGRDAEIGELTAWAYSSQNVSVKFVTGDGGVGKSRLAAEFAERLQKSDWSAGFVNLNSPLTFKMKRDGTLLVIDYPEENRAAVEEFLRSLTFIGSPGRMRVLFLSRRARQRLVWSDP